MRSNRTRRKLTRNLGVLDQSRSPQDMAVPRFRLRPLSGELRGHYAGAVSGNWRVTFRSEDGRFEDGHAVDVDYTDYH